MGHVRPAKIQISLHIRAGWSESSLGAFGIAKHAEFFMRITKTHWEHMSEGTFSHVAAQCIKT